MPQLLPNLRTASRTARIVDAPTPLRLWHLTSLDAPTVALVWSQAFAWTAHVHLPIWVPLLLALAVWPVYIADRLLDTHTALRDKTSHRLRDRHFFHWRHRRILLPLAAASTAAAAAIVFTLMPTIARERNSILAAASLVYFTGVHTTHQKSKFLSKEFLVGVLFTTGCALPALTRTTLTSVTTSAPLSITIALYALLAWLNCHAIDRWEAVETPGSAKKLPCPILYVILSAAQRSRRTCFLECRKGGIPRNHIAPIALTLSIAAFFLAAILHTQPRASALLIAASTAALLLATLDQFRHRLTPVTLRISADLALLTPLFLIPIAPHLK